VYCVDKLPVTPVRLQEAAIVNLDLEQNPGTHWVCYRKSGRVVNYYDSFGNLPPPLQLRKYLKDCDIEYNYERQQAFGSFNCGHLYLKCLSE